MKKVLSMVLCLVLTLGLLAACGGSDSSSGNGSNSTAPSSGSSNATGEVDYSEHETFTYWLYATPNDYYSSYSDNPVIQYLNNKFNVTFDFEQPSTGSEMDSLSLMFGTGEYTDAIDMSYYTGSISQLYEDGVLVDIAEYLDYMPNLKQRFEESEDFRKICYDDYGRILTLRVLGDTEEARWGGLAYRYDILETMTGGNVAFPSGKDEPTTIEDWDYMLPLFKAYFEAAGMSNYAAFILPYNGYFSTGELATGFGVNTSYYLDNDVVKYGPMEEGFYNYLKKMNEWYEAGYIYQDFASRTNDVFYLPNPELTYGAAAGAWFGLGGQIGDTMSIPDYDLYVDVRGASSPLDTEHGVTEAFPFSWAPRYDASAGGLAISTACQNIPKLLSILDYMYSDEGGMMRQNGLNAEQAEGIALYQDNGLEDGIYSFVDGEYVLNPVLKAAGLGGSIEEEAFVAVRLPAYNFVSYTKEIAREDAAAASEIWDRYYDSALGIGKLPSTLSRPVDEDKTYANNNTTITDYVDSIVPKFIMGTEPLTEESFAAFVEQLKAYGIEENLRIQQEAYDRYLTR